MIARALFCGRMVLIRTIRPVRTATDESSVDGPDGESDDSDVLRAPFSMHVIHTLVLVLISTVTLRQLSSRWADKLVLYLLGFTWIACYMMAAKSRLPNLGKVSKAAFPNGTNNKGSNSKTQATLSRFFKRFESKASPETLYDDADRGNKDVPVKASPTLKKRKQSQSSPTSPPGNISSKKARTSPSDKIKEISSDAAPSNSISPAALSALSGFSASPRREEEGCNNTRPIRKKKTCPPPGTQGSKSEFEGPSSSDSHLWKGEKKYTLMANRGTLTPLEKQVMALKAKHPDAVLFIEVGYRYRFFDRDAEIASKELNICAFPEHSYVVASIPTHRLFVHARRLVAKGYKVGVVKQTETAAIKKAGDNKTAPFERKLTALYTKSTMIGEDLQANSGGSADIGSSEHNNYLMCMHEASGTKDSKSTEVGIVAIQPSTGDIVYDCFHDNDMRQELETRVQHIRPVEILLPERLTNQTEKILKGILHKSVRDEDQIRTERLSSEHFDKNRAFDLVTAFFSSSDQNDKSDSSLQSVLRLPRPILCCLAALIHYLKEFQLDKILQQTRNMRSFTDSTRYMKLNACAVQNLEIFCNQVDNKTKGSLFWVLDHTRTSFGRRELHRWLSQPLTDRSAIVQRLDVIEELVTSDLQPLGALAEFLGKSPDLEKSICSIYHKKCSPSEFVSIMQKLTELCELCTTHAPFADKEVKSDLLRDLFVEVPRLLDDVDQFAGALDKKAAKDGDKTKLFVNADQFPALESCRQEIARISSEMEDHLRTSRSILRMPRLEFTAVSGYEYLIEVKNSLDNLIPGDWKKINMTKRFSRFRPPFVEGTFTELCIAREKLLKASEEAWLQFMDLFAEKFFCYRQAIKHLAKYDVLLSLSLVAKQEGYCRPQISDSSTACVQIENGRHPVVSALLGEAEQYVPNGTHLQGDQKRFMTITGPNMGGKSSYLKQVALIVILAQIGSYVPADEATIAPVDAVYTRMGASDDILKHQSTFMVELSEASTILSEATPRSLVILDELGRGTSTHDGMAIAYAAAKYLITEVRCLTLFVTHYPPLAELAQQYITEVANYHMSFLIDEDDKDTMGDDGHQPAVVTFLYQLADGAASHSYGLNVARMADLPPSILTLADCKSKELEEAVLSKRRRRKDFLELWGLETGQMKELMTAKQGKNI